MEALSLLPWTFDSLLGLGLLWFAWRSLTCKDLFVAIISFVAFGLLMTLAWVRLNAPDVALAEVAIGSGLTGALLLTVLARLRALETSEHVTEQLENEEPGVMTFRFLPILILLLVAAGLNYTVFSLPSDAAGLSEHIISNLQNSGVSNHTTAVLLNFRGYDTLLEMFVLLIALLGVWSLDGAILQSKTEPGPVLDTLSRLLLPILILVAAYLLWAGANAPGGAFQAGSILGAAGVLLLLTGWQLRAGLAGLPLRLMLVTGPAAFIAVAVFTMLIDGLLLEYPLQYAGKLILFIEIAATVSIATTLVALFLGGPPENNKEQR